MVLAVESLQQHNQTNPIKLHANKLFSFLLTSSGSSSRYVSRCTPSSSLYLGLTSLPIPKLHRVAFSKNSSNKFLWSTKVWSYESNSKPQKHDQILTVWLKMHVNCSLWKILLFSTVSCNPTLSTSEHHIVVSALLIRKSTFCQKDKKFPS